MAVCKVCEKELGYHDRQTGRLNGCCVKCSGKIAEPDNPQPSTPTLSEAINAIMLTTETAPNLNITKRIEIVTAECAFGMNVF